MRNLAIVNFPGFACLFYGSPGTGKTETVLQLSRKTRRPIFQANISDLKSKWVGESEKKIQGLFSKYEETDCGHQETNLERHVTLSKL